jgi:multidrug efflux pump subunit AcrB
MTDEQVDLEDVATLVVDKSVSKMKKYQNKKRKNLLKRLENTYTHEESNTEMESNRNAMTINQNSSTLSKLYLFSGIIFLLLSALFSIKLWLRFDFDSFTQQVLLGEK